MSPTTIRVDDETKNKAQQLAKGIGFSFNDLVVILLKKAIREGGVDLRLTENSFTPEFENDILKSHGENNYKTFESVEEMINSTENDH